MMKAIASRFKPTHWGYPIALFLAVLVPSFKPVFSQAPNPISIENALTGNPISEWGVPNFRDTRINGFATNMSLNAGATVRFKIDVEGSADYTIKIYRIGYYNGDGARLIQDLGTFSGTDQSAPSTDPITGKVDCSGWTESASWPIPSGAVSGLYIARLERSGGGSNHIVFIVRNDGSSSELYMMLPDATWQAYNGYGGSNLYDGSTGLPQGHASEVSYNRPFFLYNAGFATDNRQSDWYMNAEYPMIRWLERNGYDITYTSCGDVAEYGGRILDHLIFISLGHDEYWSREMRDNVEFARDAGIHLAFFSGNEVYWKTRWADNFRTLICYKEGTLGDGTLDERACGFKCDPSSPVWTGLWRTGKEYDAGEPENALTGQISWNELAGAIEVPAYYKRLRFWRNTSVAGLSAGQTATLAPNTLGYEWDQEQPLYAPYNSAGRFTMSKTNLGSLVHNLSFYRHPNGAIVFGAGTIQWSWGLDGNHFGGVSAVSQEMQQATVNLLADMGAQPATIQGSLVTTAASTDFSSPASVINAPLDGTVFPSASSIDFSGTATDNGGGVIAGVEISIDGGNTWEQALIDDIGVSVNWSFTKVITVSGLLNIKIRSVDDSGNLEVAGSGINITIIPPDCPCTIFLPSMSPTESLTNDGQGIEVGIKFHSSEDGFINGIRYFKSPGTTGVHTGQLWTSSGSLLGSVTFSAETASGWQQADFASPIAIDANTTYIAAYFSPSGDYAATNQYFNNAVINGPLVGLADGDDGPNGVFAYSNISVFPNDNYLSTNYWVDVSFSQTLGTPLPVRWLEFEVEKHGNDALLRWSTIHEEGNQGFNVQRSSDGSAWTNIGFVDGTGTINNTRQQYRYRDRNLLQGKYFYRLRQVDYDGNYNYSTVVSVMITGQAVLFLGQNYPNPFDATTFIDFTLPQTGKIRLTLMDVNGRPIRVLIDEVKGAGKYVIPMQRNSLSAGMYYYRLETEHETKIMKMTIL